MTIELWALMGFGVIILMTIMIQSMIFTAKFGLSATLGSRDQVNEDAGILLPRLDRAVRNSIEAMVIFAPLILIGAVAETSNSITVTASIVFLAARAVFPLLYAIGAVPFRTMSWSISLFAIMALVFGLVSELGLPF